MIERELPRFLCVTATAWRLPQRAARRLSKLGKRFLAAILLDLILPDMVGWQILHAIRSEGPNQNTPIIVTTIVTEKDAARGFPIQDFLSKPVEPKSLINALARTAVQPPKTKGRIRVVDDNPKPL